jgi:hypothetical protein
MCDNNNKYESYENEDIISIESNELTHEAMVKIVKKNMVREKKAAKRREEFRKIRTLLEAEDRDTAL